MPGLIGICYTLCLSEYNHAGVFNPHFHGSIRGEQATHLSYTKTDLRIELNIGAHTPFQCAMDVNGTLRFDIHILSRFKEWLALIFSRQHPVRHLLKIGFDPGVVFGAVHPAWLGDWDWLVSHHLLGLSFIKIISLNLGLYPIF